MKKLLLLLSLCVMSACCVFGFNACGDTNPSHTHEYTDMVVEPTCTKDGYVLHLCSCGYYFKEDVAKVSHDYEWTITQEPTETEEGVNTGVCKLCGDIITENVPTLNHEHKYVISFEKPTCTEQGYTLHKCACGDEFKDDFVNALGHNCTESLVEPTCVGQGYTAYVCSRCEEIFKDDFTNATGHTYTYVENSFDDANMTAEFKCSKCDKTVSKSVEFVSEHLEGGYTSYIAKISNGIGGIQPVMFNIYNENSGYHLIGIYNGTPIRVKAYDIMDNNVEEYNAAIDYFFYNSTLRWSEGAPANCSTYGIAVFTCTVCDERIVIALSGEHFGLDEHQVRIVDGHIEEYCTDCGRWIKVS
ncbi:MAG: hypothetical protein IJQ07_02655 [Clostridia bacterium]|nr:hypothetical protein [Clostridia bacterium]